MNEKPIEFTEESGGEIKQNNFRLNTVSVEEFKDFCTRTGWSQAKSFSYLMHILKLQEMKVAVPGRATEIDEFERHSKALVSAFLNALEIATDTEERVHENYKLRLDSKDTLLVELQKNMTSLQEQLQARQNELTQAKERIQTLEQSLRAVEEKAETAANAANDKEQLNVILAQKLRAASEQAEGYEKLKEASAALEQELHDTRQTLESERQNAALELERTLRTAELEKERLTAAAEKERTAALTETERKYTALLIEKEKEISEMRKENEAKFETKFLEAYSRISALQEEKADWKEQLYRLKERMISLENENHILKETISSSQTKDDEE